MYVYSYQIKLFETNIKVKRSTTATLSIRAIVRSIIHPCRLNSSPISAYHGD